MAVYVSNVGELAMLKAILRSHELNLGLYAAHITPDGNTIMSHITDLTITGGYAHKTINRNVITGSASSGNWRVATNTDGKAEAQYGGSSSAQSWTFDQSNVSQNETAYGIYMYYYKLSFDTGKNVIYPGQVVTSKSSASISGTVNAIYINSGSWASSTAAGDLVLGSLSSKAKSSTFAVGAVFKNASSADVGTVTTASAKHLFYVEAFSSEQDIDTVGQKIQYLPKLTLATA